MFVRLTVGTVGRNPKILDRITGRAEASVWNGKKWTAAPVAAPGKGNASTFGAVTCLRPTFCVAVGLRRSALGTSQLSGFWKGKTWHLVP